ncbi:pseudouridine synthase [Companilactobacillus sp. RD055328]|uniref:pseudouridine synthase n=1 Tax=Companilactobacillus sp. RD055328 TaxID=2916634 RepID=UPI001FC8E8B1|nr:pseudouridine synthase [Companilactobacillus sp. RD055328]GKQ42739.1 pseudouridine synthase [Companilactobacillus sp. RD055328]
MAEKQRLQKVMANAGVASRRKSEELITMGEVTVNGTVITELGYKVEPKDKIKVSNKLIHQEEKRYILFYKPRGVISSVKDEKGRKVVTDYIKDIDERVYPVGRLDYDTSGLLILTNDGDFANRLMHPKYKVDKTYIAKLNGIPKREDLAKLEKGGLKVKDYRVSPAKVKIMSEDRVKNKAIVRITIHEGHNHQVKDMFSTIGYQVDKLSRERYGFLTLDGMTSGEYRDLGSTEVSLLLKNKK